MKRTIAGILFVSGTLHAALTTNVMCIATTPTLGVLVSTSNPNSCQENADAPGFPGLPGYRTLANATATTTSGTLTARVQEGQWLLNQTTRVVATARASFEDDVTFTGSGPAILRVTVGISTLTTDDTGSFVYSVNGTPKAATWDNSRLPVVFTVMDFPIELGEPTQIRWLGFTGAQSENQQHSVGFKFGTEYKVITAEQAVFEPSSIAMCASTLPAALYGMRRRLRSRAIQKQFSNC